MDLREAELTNYTTDGRHPWELARFEFVYKQIKRFAPNLSQQRTTIVDIGCGDTFFVENLALRIENIDIVAVDTAFTDEILQSLSIRYATNKLPIKAFRDMETAMQHVKNPVSIVLLLDVIEHVEKEVDMLKSLNGNSAFTNDTLFIITVPAFQSLFCSHDEFLGHYRRYNNHQLQQAVNEANFKVLEKGYFFTFLIFIRLLQMLIEKISKPNKNKGIGAWKNNPFKDKLLLLLLTTDFKISMFLKKIGITVAGLSNYALCKKSVS